MFYVVIPQPDSSFCIKEVGPDDPKEKFGRYFKTKGEASSYIYAFYDGLIKVHECKILEIKQKLRLREWE